jgi:N-acetylneuraminic acid mutarotase
MKKLLLVLVIVASLISACSGENATPAPVPTEVSEATATSNPEPTQVSEATATPNLEPTKTPEAAATPQPNPRPRALPRMAYDAESNQVILFGGVISAEGRTIKDTWSHDMSTNTWRQIKSTPSPGKGDGPMAYDAESDRVIFFVGCRFGLTDKPYDCVPASETWSYDSNANAWTNMEPTTAPYGLLGTRMVYDTKSDRMILFGGWDPTNPSDDGAFSDTWAYDYNTNTWTKMEPEVSPPGRYFHAMAHDAESERVILWGGGGLVPIDVSSVWAYDYDADTWEELESSGAPSPVGYAAMVYNGVTDQTILYARQELWAFDYDANTWTLLSDSPLPGKLIGHAMVYADKADRVLLFGGGPTHTSFGNKTWTYDLDADTWTDVTVR